MFYKIEGSTNFFSYHYKKAMYFLNSKMANIAGKFKWFQAIQPESGQAHELLCRRKTGHQSDCVGHFKLQGVIVKKLTCRWNVCNIKGEKEPEDPYNNLT